MRERWAGLSGWAVRRRASGAVAAAPLGCCGSGGLALLLARPAGWPPGVRPRRVRLGRSGSELRPRAEPEHWAPPPPSRGPTDARRSPGCRDTASRPVPGACRVDSRQREGSARLGFASPPTPSCRGAWRGPRDWAAARRLRRLGRGRGRVHVSFQIRNFVFLG